MTKTNVTSTNLPDISYPNKLRATLRSIRGWVKLTGIDIEYEPRMFMKELGKLFIEYFQFHALEAKSIGEEFFEELNWAVRFINLNYVYRTHSRLTRASDWVDVWPTACLTATNIESFGMMFGEIVGELDAGGIWEYVEERRELESLEPHQRPKNVPKYHWWWFTEYKPKGFFR